MRRWAALVIIWGLGAVSGSMVGWTSALFTSTTSNPGNSFAAAASFCPTPSSQTVLSDKDSYVREDAVGSNFGTAVDLWVQSRDTRDRRTLVSFPLPSKPGGCVVSSAVLRLNVPTTFSSGRTIEAYRIGESWTETGVTWTNKPVTVGSPTTSASGSTTGWKEWNVTTQVDAMYSGTNNGLLLKDQTESAGTQEEQVYSSREGANKPELVVNFSSEVCSSPGSQTLTATQDSWIQQDGANANNNFGTDTLLDVKSDATAKNRRALVRFDTLPTIPAGCSFTGATLGMFAASTQGTRTFEAIRIAGAWTELGVTWNNFTVGTTGAAATTSNGTGWREWNVQSQVQAWYDTGNDFGFLIKDSVEESATAVTTTFHSRENTSDPQLVVTFG